MAQKPPTSVANENDMYTSGESADTAKSDEAGSVASGEVEPPPSQEQIEAWRSELKKTEEEIATLRSVLHSKVKHSNDLKKQLGVTPMQEFKKEMTDGFKSITESEAFKKTKEGLNKAGEKTTSVWSSMSKKLSDARHSDAFKSFEDKLSNVKAKASNRVTGTKSEQNFEEALREATEAAEADKAKEQDKVAEVKQ